MKFLVSAWGDDCPVDTNGRVIEEAVQEEYVRVDARTTDCPSKIGVYKKSEAEWWDNGTNHRVENGSIKRDFPAQGWFLYVDSLEDLKKIVDKYEGLSMTKSFGRDDFLEVCFDYGD